jgi:hypothetical protein
MKASGVELELPAAYEMTYPCSPLTPSFDPLNMESGDVEQRTLTCEIRMPSSDILLLHTCALYILVQENVSVCNVAFS